MKATRIQATNLYKLGMVPGLSFLCPQLAVVMKAICGPEVMAVRISTSMGTLQTAAQSSGRAVVAIHESKQ